MRRSLRLAVVVVATLAFAAWVALIGNQQSPPILVLAEAAVLATAAVALRRVLLGKPAWVLLAVGATTGFVGAIVAAAANQIALRGIDRFLSRDFTQDLYFYPSVSLSWLYGAVVIAMLFCEPSPRPS